jgi:D-alanyl-D-alanine carboxypeptidase/D-alanyl-D-alanine-endopeptidase (penicillin-binding protein 4)
MRICFLTLALTLSLSNVYANEIPSDLQKIMHQTKYEHGIWGIYVKDLESGEILFDLNSEKLFSPASTTKLFSIAALLNGFGDDYRFKTPVYATGKIENGKLEGNLILVAQGDLTMGGRESEKDKISFTKMDHIIANEVPGVILTKEDPLHGFNELAKQIAEKGIKEISGDIIIDDSLFEITQKRGMVLSPMIINENLIDIIISPTMDDKQASLSWRPEVHGYVVHNKIKTVAKGGTLSIQINSDDAGQEITVEGTIPSDQSEIIRTFPIKDPKNFGKLAFIQALQKQGVKINPSQNRTNENITLSTFKDAQKIALWTSPPITEYAKLILKVSHNLGADLVPLLLASHKGKKTFDDGMFLIGEFLKNKVKLSEDSFVLIDAAGGNENRFTPQGEIQLLEYVHKQSAPEFKHFFDALPILGVDGSLEDFAKNSPGAGKVHSKPGTGVAYNLATNKFFLITQALGGFIEGKNGHLFAYMVVVNNGAMPTINDIFGIFEDVSQLSSKIYEQTNRD